MKDPLKIVRMVDLKRRSGGNRKRAHSPPKDKSCLKPISVCGCNCGTVTKLRCDCISLLWQEPFVFETTIVLRAVLKSWLWQTGGLLHSTEAPIAQKNFHQIRQWHWQADEKTEICFLTGNSNAKMDNNGFCALPLFVYRDVSKLCPFHKSCISIFKISSQRCLETPVPEGRSSFEYVKHSCWVWSSGWC